RTELGLVPALKTSKPPRLSARNNPSPIWLRAELPVHRTRIFFFVILDLPVREHRKRCTARIRRTREKRSPSAPAYPPTPRFPILHYAAASVNAPPNHFRLIHRETFTREMRD